MIWGKRRVNERGGSCFVASLEALGNFESSVKSCKIIFIEYICLKDCNVLAFSGTPLLDQVGCNLEFIISNPGRQE